MIDFLANILINGLLIIMSPAMSAYYETDWFLENKDNWKNQKKKLFDYVVYNDYFVIVRVIAEFLSVFIICEILKRYNESITYVQNESFIVFISRNMFDCIIMFIFVIFCLINICLLVLKIRINQIDNPNRNKTISSMQILNVVRFYLFITYMLMYLYFNNYQKNILFQQSSQLINRLIFINAIHSIDILCLMTQRVTSLTQWVNSFIDWTFHRSYH